MEINRKVLLFDVDGTLTLPREKIEKEMKDRLIELKDAGYIMAVVGGGTYLHVEDQLEDFTKKLDYIFSENGTKSYYKGEVFHEKLIKTVIGDKVLNDIINFSLRYMARMDIPIKRGTFFELRTGLVNICPMGRNCSYEERLIFTEFDSKNKVLKKFRDALDEKFSKQNNLVFTIGSSISIDMFIEGYRKPYCLQFLEDKDILFFGDKTSLGGNDHEISIDPRILRSFTVTSPTNLLEVLKDLDSYFNQ